MNKMALIIFSICVVSCFGGESVKELQGPDLDKDGVRDDIQKWIESRDNVSNEYKIALKYYAKNLRKSFLFLNDRDSSIVHTRSKLNIDQCLSILIDEAREHLLPLVQKSNKLKSEIKEQYNQKELSYKNNHEKMKELNTWYGVEQEKRSALYGKARKEYYRIQEIDSLNKAKVLSMTFDTRAKLRAQAIMSSHFSGQSMSFSSGKSKYCSFLKRSENDK